MRSKAAFSYQFKNFLRLFGWTYLWTILVAVILPFLIALVLGQMHAFSLADYMPRSLPSIVLGVFVFAFGGFTYDGFKLFIQNGIGRKTYFYSKLYALSCILLVGELINIIYGMLYNSFVTSKPTELFTFTALYGKYFSSGVANTVAVMVITLLFIFCIMVTGMLLGTILGLFSRRAQVMMIVGIPIVLFILMVMLVILNNQSSLKLTWLPKFLMFMIGYDGSQTKVGSLTAFSPMISGSVYSLIVLLITYRLTLRLRVPR